jgi:hypothetical protein
MAPIAYEWLKALRLTAIIQELQDVRQLPQQLRFLSRTPIVPATDGEILARWTGYVQIADLVADDQRALVYSSGKLSYETTNIPNIKHGVSLSQEQLNQMQAIAANPGIQRDEAMVTDWVMRNIDGLLLGVRQRMEALCVAMSIDDLDYNRFGITITNGSWGMPADLKVTTSTPWAANPTTATPVNDAWAIRRNALVRYGQEFDRMTMSTQALMTMVATTEFQNKARAYLAPNVSFVNLNQADLGSMESLARTVLGVAEIELYDARYWSQSANGELTSAPFLPINQIVFSSRADDNNPMVADFASTVVTETIVDSLTGGQVLGGLAPQRGPIAYATPTTPDLNAPGVTMWGVARGFPRKHKRQATAVLNIGPLNDTIPVGPPF